MNNSEIDPHLPDAEDLEVPFSFYPKVGTLVMLGHAEGAVAGCGVVQRVYKDEDTGDRMYVIQMNLGMAFGRPAERVTQKELDQRGFHIATLKEWQEDWERVKQFHKDQVEELYDQIKQYLIV